MTASAALEEGVVTPGDSGDGCQGPCNRADRIFHDRRKPRHSAADLRRRAGQVPATSAPSRSVRRISPQKMWSYLNKFGVGQPTGLHFPGESAGILATYRDWNGSQRYTVLFGQGLSVHAVQAAGGLPDDRQRGLRMPPAWSTPLCLHRDRHHHGPQHGRARIISPQVAEEVRTMLEGVVSTRAPLQPRRFRGYRVAGKTGTAQRFRPDLRLLPRVHRLVHRDGRRRTTRG